MAIKLIANYAKRLGLPGFSSHQFCVSVETELHDVTDIAGESARLYSTLQQAVDEQIQLTGFVPPDGYGMNGQTNGHSNGANGHRTNGNGSHHADAGITERQIDLISRVVKENNLSKTAIDNLSVEMFGGGVRTLNRMQASNLIDDLFERYPKKANGNGNGSRFQRQGARV